MTSELTHRMRPKPGKLPRRPPGHAQISEEMLNQRWAMLPEAAAARPQLLDPLTARQMAVYAHNIENFIGTAKVPIGLVGPLRVNGLFAQGDYYVPLATTEAALVASYSRGAKIISESGGASAALLSEGVSRAPGFVFENLEELSLFLQWAADHEKQIKKAAESTSAHAKLADLEVTIDGRHVYFMFVFTTGDAAGQNMVTFATNAALDWIKYNTPVQPRRIYLESNFSGDKKASALSLQRVRGKKVAAEVRLPRELVERELHATPAAISECARLGLLGGVLSGTLGTQAHFANGLAALFIACGQDAACVAEAAIGTTSFEVDSNDSLYVSVTLPNLIVGTVGGGTQLPSQRACLQIMRLADAGNSRAFAEVAASLCLAGEISLVGAISAGNFARAHARLARGSDSPLAKDRRLPSEDG
ncbi:MAG: 3-hydroxy-3-methylglutaryl-CoA reductase [Deltaproteobacteria bacterium]|nr:3-hydroxy-3-methylglutaryl-CoA reductase [Deltaproteobacteria bacterium]